MSFNIVQLRKALRTRYLWLVNGDGAHAKFEREKNPGKFWFAFTLHCLGILLMAALTVVICFGLLRKPSS